MPRVSSELPGALQESCPDNQPQRPFLHGGTAFVVCWFLTDTPCWNYQTVAKFKPNNLHQAPICEVFTLHSAGPCLADLAAESGEMSFLEPSCLSLVSITVMEEIIYCPSLVTVHRRRKSGQELNTEAEETRTQAETMEEPWLAWFVCLFFLYNEDPTLPGGGSTHSVWGSTTSIFN